MMVLNSWFWVVLGTLTVLGAATAVGLTMTLDRLWERLGERRGRVAPATRWAGAPRGPDAHVAVRRHRRRAGPGGAAHI